MLAFVVLLMPPPLTKIGIIYTQVLGGRGLSNDTQIRVITSMEPEKCTNTLRYLSEKLTAKCSVTTLSHLVKIAHLNDAFSEIIVELEASSVEGESLQQKDKRRRKRK